MHLSESGEPVARWGGWFGWEGAKVCVGGGVLYSAFQVGERDAPLQEQRVSCVVVGCLVNCSANVWAVVG
eukprot:358824-Chlamydomonas_euryale.AAC.5